MNIIWKKPDGGIAVTHLTSEAESIEHEALKLKERGDIPPDWEIAATDIDLPTDREFRAAWAWTTDKPSIDIDITKAKGVTKDRLRRERQPLLEQLDLDFMKAMENNDSAAMESIKAEKQRLRDITSKVDKLKTLDSMRKLKGE